MNSKARISKFSNASKSLIAFLLQLVFELCVYFFPLTVFSTILLHYLRKN